MLACLYETSLMDGDGKETGGCVVCCCGGVMMMMRAVAGKGTPFVFFNFWRGESENMEGVV